MQTNMYIQNILLDQQIVIMDDGTIAAIMMMFDDYGDETNDPDIVAALTAFHPCGKYLAIDYLNFQHHLNS